MSPRLKFVLLILVFAFPFIGSTISYFFYQPAKKMNYGELLDPPVTLPAETLKPIAGTDSPAVDLQQGLRGKWLLLTKETAACDKPCQQKLYAMRQARTMLGKNQERVVRVILVDNETLPPAEITQNYAGTLWIRANESSWHRKLAEKDSHAGSFIYVVDPLGNVFIRYPADADIKKMVRDLERVLKISQIG